MNIESVYQDIAKRTNGSIYIGVVGPVRTGKSTFIKRFMETLVIPEITDIYLKERTIDELPQSGSGRTIMTAEPKFVPETPVELTLEQGVGCSVRLIDCVGYLVEGAVGQTENGTERMVMTPWYDEEIPMTLAAEEGTTHVIGEHSTIGILITTDGSVCGLPRDAYKVAEQRTAAELARIGKPYVILLNCAEPEQDNAKQLAAELSEEYGVCCLPVNCQNLEAAGFAEIMRATLYEFPVKQCKIYLPSWTEALENDSQIKSSLFNALQEISRRELKLKDIPDVLQELRTNDYIESAVMSEMLPSSGDVSLNISLPKSLYYQTISEESGFSIQNDGDLMQLLQSLSHLKSEYERVHQALCDVREKGYGIVMPCPEEMHLEEPEIVRQGNRYGVRLKASAPSIHMMRANIETEVSPALGGGKASEEILSFLLQGFDGDIGRIWESNIFGKSLYDIAGESVATKIQSLPAETQTKLQQTLQKIINEGSGGLICIIL